ncbi:MAG: GGDEF domain-containing phosphodiesterase, partial [Gammaproteobacteria bacterium]|nr:GGDEF domain-containing phosphodiesterase [Gammaproteobacteria bacterium]
GIALFPDHAKNTEDLLRHSEVAMYLAKARKEGIFVYDYGEDKSSAKKIKLITDLRDAIQNAYLSVHYQPIIDFNNPSKFRIEALARWKHPLHGFISPMVFIDLAEQIGLIKPLTNLILGKTLAECSELLRDGRLTSVSVNFSPPLFSDEGISEQLDSLIKMHRLTNESLKLEITESAMMSDSSLSIKNMHKLHDMGFKIVIDDFGTGLSSLFKLKDLPVSELKIDKAFITNITNEKKDAAIAKAAIQLAQSLGMRVVAEGIEDEKTWYYLKEIGCDYGQGFWMAKPMPINELINWIEKR